MTAPITISVENCSTDCPHFRAQRSLHFTGARGWVYTCLKAGRTIMPYDGVKPPPTWCPIRPAATSRGEHG